MRCRAHFKLERTLQQDWTTQQQDWTDILGVLAEPLIIHEGEGGRDTGGRQGEDGGLGLLEKEERERKCV